MLKTFKLKNGLNVATYSIPQMRSAFLSLAVKGGSIFDTKETAGAAHFMEHLLVQGIPSLPNVEAFSDFIEGIAGSYGATTYSQAIRFHISAPAAHLDDILKIGSEVFFEALFKEDAILRERGAVLEEIREKQDNLWYKNSRFFAKTRFKPGHVMQLEPGGSEEVVKKLHRPNLVKYWSDFFYPKNTYLVIVGGFENQQAEKLINDYFGKHSSAKNFPGFPDFTNQDFSGRQVAIRQDMNLKTCYVDFTFPSIIGDFPIEERLPQSIVRSILGGLRASRLFRLLRQRRGLVYDISFGSVVFQRFGYAYISSQVAKEKLEEVIRLIIQELSAFIKIGPLKEEIEFAKNYHINRTLMQFDHPGAIADWIEDDLMWEDKIYTPEEYVKLIESVSMEDIINFMQKYWDFEKLNLIIQGPIKNTSTNIKKFEGLIAEIR